MSPAPGSAAAPLQAHKAYPQALRKAGSPFSLYKEGEAPSSEKGQKGRPQATKAPPYFSAEYNQNADTPSTHFEQKGVLLHYVFHFDPEKSPEPFPDLSDPGLQESRYFSHNCNPLGEVQKGFPPDLPFPEDR